MDWHSASRFTYLLHICRPRIWLKPEVLRGHAIQRNSFDRWKIAQPQHGYIHLYERSSQICKNLRLSSVAKRLRDRHTRSVAHDPAIIGKLHPAGVAADRHTGLRQFEIQGLGNRSSGVWQGRPIKCFRWAKASPARRLEFGRTPGHAIQLLYLRPPQHQLQCQQSVKQRAKLSRFLG